MTRISAIATSLALGAATLAVPASAWAASETEMARDAKFTIAQAIDAAEAKGAGKATDAAFDDDNAAAGRSRSSPRAATS